MQLCLCSCLKILRCLMEFISIVLVISGEPVPLGRRVFLCRSRQCEWFRRGKTLKWFSQQPNVVAKLDVHSLVNRAMSLKIFSGWVHKSAVALICMQQRVPGSSPGIPRCSSSRAGKSISLLKAVQSHHQPVKIDNPELEETMV